MVKSESDIIDTIHTGQVITDENGTQYFVCGRNRIKISEHFAAGGRPLDDLIVDVAACGFSKPDLDVTENILKKMGVEKPKADK